MEEERGYTLAAIEGTVTDATANKFLSSPWPKTYAEFPLLGKESAAALAASEYKEPMQLVAHLIGLGGSLETTLACLKKLLPRGVNYKAAALVITLKLAREYHIPPPPAGWEALVAPKSRCIK